MLFVFQILLTALRRGCNNNVNYNDEILSTARVHTIIFFSLRKSRTIRVFVSFGKNYGYPNGNVWNRYERKAKKNNENRRRSKREKERIRRRKKTMQWNKDDSVNQLSVLWSIRLKSTLGCDCRINKQWINICGDD